MPETGKFKSGDRVVALVGPETNNNPVDHGTVDGYAYRQDGALVDVSVSWDDGHGSVVPESALRAEIGVDMAGCWLDGGHGWQNGDRAVGLAEEHGFTLGADDRALREWYQQYSRNADLISDVDVLTLPSGERLSALSAVEAFDGHDGMVDGATEYLRGLLPAGYDLAWDAGELCMVESEEDTDNG